MAVTGSAISISDISTQLDYTNGFLLFFVIVVLCVFVYKFFNIFFKL